MRSEWTIFTSSSPETQLSSLEATGSLQTVCLDGRWAMSQTPGVGNTSGIAGTQELWHPGNCALPSHFREMGFPKDSPVVIEIGSTRLVCEGSEPLCSQAGLFTGDGVGRSADTWAVSLLNLCFLSGLPSSWKISGLQCCCAMGPWALGGWLYQGKGQKLKAILRPSV